ncbi:MAG: hypothetical protein RLZZ40_907, partial [Actinomycetota bacterium]
MNRIVKAATAFFAVAALPLLAVAPAAATTVSELAYTFDCNNDDWYSNYSIAVPNGGTMDVELINCDGYYLGEDGDTGNAATEDGTAAASADLAINDASEVVTLSGPVELYLLGVSGDWESSFVELIGMDALDMPDPEGVKLVDSSETIPLAADTFSIGTADEIANVDNILISGNDSCDIVAGDHVYTVQRFHVSLAGTYYFRVIGTDPLSDYINWHSPSTPFDDPMVALYDGEFDPANANDNVVGCNDDFNDYSDLDGVDWETIAYENDDYAFGVTSDDIIMEGHFPIFQTELEPGDYTFVFTTWERVTAADWAGDGYWEPTAMTVEYDVWGPENGLET